MPKQQDGIPFQRANPVMKRSYRIGLVLLPRDHSIHLNRYSFFLHLVVLAQEHKSIHVVILLKKGKILIGIYALFLVFL
jgi:hypothetical protein